MIGLVLPEDFVDEVGTSIAYNYPGYTKARKDYFMEHSLGIF